MLVSLWLVWAFVAQLPCGTGRAATPSPPIHPIQNELEGSGHGTGDDDLGGLDLMGLFDGDDDDDYDGYDDDDDEDEDDDIVDYDDYDYDSEEDDYKDNADYNDDFYDGLHTSFGDVIYDTDGIKERPTNAHQAKTTLCFRCHGDGMGGCNITDMLSDMERFTVTCVGKCLNISTGSVAVYDCAKDLATKENVCLDDFDTRMCFCEGNLCNRPVNLSTDLDVLISQLLQPLNINNNNNRKQTDNNASNNYYTSVRSNISNDEKIKLSNEISAGSSSKTKTTSTNTIPLNENIGRGHSSLSTADAEGLLDLSRHYVSEAEIDIIIPVGKVPDKTVGDGNHSSEEDTSVNYSSGDVHSLSVASLRDGGSGCSRNAPLGVLVFLLSMSLQFVCLLLVLS